MAAPRKYTMHARSLCHQDPQPQERDTPWEAFHRRFSQFQYEEAAGPRDTFCQLWELCYQWLKPQTRSVEQILALLVTEKFLQILPADTENSTSMLSLETRERLFTLIEGLRRDNGEAENTVPFQSFMDAEFARLYLMRKEETLEGVVHRELRVTGSNLIIRVTSENSSLLHNSVSSLLSQLPTVATDLRFFVPEFFKPHQR